MTECMVLAESDAIYLDASALPKIDLESDGGHGIRLLLLVGRIPLFCSVVALGEFFAVAGRRKTQAKIGVSGYLYTVRDFLIDIEMNKLRYVEPVADRRAFTVLCDDLVSRHSALGGADIWHIMAAMNLQRRYKRVTMLTFDQRLAAAAAAEGMHSVYGQPIQAEALVAALTSCGKWGAP